MRYEESAAKLLEDAATQLRRRYRFLDKQLSLPGEKCRHCREPRSKHLMDGSDRCTSWAGSGVFAAIHYPEAIRLGEIINMLETVIDELDKVPQ